MVKGVVMSAGESVPTALVETMLREYLADEDAVLTSLVTTPIPGEGFSGNTLYRVHLSWAPGRPSRRSGSADWVIKRWLPGGQGEALLGVTRPLEALAWEQGLLRREALPAGVAIPIIGTQLDPTGTSAW